MHSSSSSGCTLYVIERSSGETQMIRLFQRLAECLVTIHLLWAHLPCITIKQHRHWVHQRQMAWPIQEGKSETLEVGLFPLKMIVSSLLGLWPDVHGIVGWPRWVTNCNNTHGKKFLVHTQPCFMVFVSHFEIKLAVFLWNWSLHYQPLQNSLLNGNRCIHCQNWLTLIANKSLIPGWGQRQHTAAWRPERANPVARQQFTDRRGGGGGSNGVLHCCPRPCLSFVIVASRLDRLLARLWIIDLILPKHQRFTVLVLPEISDIRCHWPPVWYFLRLRKAIKPTLAVVLE